MNEQLELINKIHEEWNKIINTHFPENFVQTSGSSGPHFHAEFSKSNQYYENSGYFYKDWKAQFFHITNLKALFSIVNHRNFRMYNLHNSNDERELYSMDIFDPKHQHSEARKSDIFTFSFSPIDKLYNKKLWNNYGDTAIIFAIECDPLRWNNFHMSEMKYSPNAVFEKYHHNILEIQLKYPSTRFDLELIQMMAFHKEKKWSYENEVRILTKWKGNFDERFNTLKKDFRISDHRIGFTEYLELPIWVDNNGTPIKHFGNLQNLKEDQFINTPKIVLKKITFGSNCGMSSQDLNRQRGEIERYIWYNLGYNVPVDPNLLDVTET